MTIEEIEQLGARDQKDEIVNSIVENTMKLAANVTELHEVHGDLVTGKGQLLL